MELDAGDFEFAASQLVSELATNAVIHARTRFSVSVSLEGDCLRLTVADRSPRSPVTKSHSREATTGRGLSLVGALSDDWGVQHHQGGKAIWALIRARETGSWPASDEASGSVFDDFGGIADLADIPGHDRGRGPGGSPSSPRLVLA